MMVAPPSSNPKRQFKMAEVETPDGSLLVVILDTSPGQKLLRNGEAILSNCLNGIMAFCNSHLMLNPRNKLAVVACHSHNSEFLYPLPNNDELTNTVRSQDGRYELFAQVNNSIVTSIKDLILNRSHGIVYPESLLGGALCKSLCYINRIEKETKLGQKLSSRILVVTAAGDYASQYMNFMNVFFTAQKQNVVLDTCMLDSDSGLLQQGCELTGGIYLRIPHLEGFLQYLLWVYFPDPHLRKMMSLPTPTKVDFRAACFCHRNLIEIGYVCSVCLSIFCNFSPICSTCQTVFKFLGPPPAKKKKLKQATGING